MASLRGAVMKVRRTPHYIRGWGKIFKEISQRPQGIPQWLQDRFSSSTAIREAIPWISYPAVDYLRKIVKPETRVFEWGSGGSTIFFALLGARVSSMESSLSWKKIIDEGLQKQPEEVLRRIDMRFVPAEESPQKMQEYIDEVAKGGPWDLILVDGWERVRCIETARAHTAPGGVILLDNANLAHYKDVPQIMAGFERIQFPGFGPSRMWPTQTDAYIKPA